MTSEPRIYPSHCHVLSKTLNEWVPIRIADLLALKEVEGFEGQGIYFYQNHPIKWFKLTGAIVAINHFANRVCYTLDDFSGATIECICRAPPNPAQADPNKPAPYGAAKSAKAKAPAVEDPMISPDGPVLKGIEVTNIVKIKGMINVFRDARQIAMKRITLLPDTDAELDEIVKRTGYMRDVLWEPWVLSEEMVGKCLRAAEREEWKVKERKKRGVKEGVRESEGKEERRKRKKKERERRREKEAKEKEEEEKNKVVEESREREVWLREQTLARERRKRKVARRAAGR